MCRYRYDGKHLLPKKLLQDLFFYKLNPFTDNLNALAMSPVLEFKIRYLLPLLPTLPPVRYSLTDLEWEDSKSLFFLRSYSNKNKKRKRKSERDNLSAGILNENISSHIFQDVKRYMRFKIRRRRGKLLNKNHTTTLTRRQKTYYCPLSAIVRII